MKKIIIALYLTASFVTPLFAQVTSEELSKNSNFSTYVTKFNSLIQYMTATFAKNELLTVKNQIDIIKKQNLSKSDELAAVANILKYNDITGLGSTLDIISSNHYEVTKTYGTINSDIYGSAYNIVTENTSTTSSFVEESGCRRPWRFGLCAAAVGVEGAALLAACEAATVGVGTPACVAAAALWAANGVADCREKYCDPVVAY